MRNCIGALVGPFTYGSVLHKFASLASLQSFLVSSFPTFPNLGGILDWIAYDRCHDHWIIQKILKHCSYHGYWWHIIFSAHDSADAQIESRVTTVTSTKNVPLNGTPFISSDFHRRGDDHLELMRHNGVHICLCRCSGIVILARQ